MPVRKDDSGRRWVEMELDVPGTPEQVWHAIATGPGISAWFTPTTVDEHVGGAVTFDFGDESCDAPGQPGVVTGWEPPTRFSYEEADWSANTPVPSPLATEVEVTARSGGRCVIRMVHSLFTDKDDWDDELESFESGWAGFFEVLRIYLAHFPGQQAATAWVTTGSSGSATQVWAKLTSALNLAGVNVGEHRVTPTDTPRLAGTVESVRRDDKHPELTVRLDAPTDGVAVIGAYQMGDEAQGVVGVYYYGADAATTAAAEKPKWVAWMRDLLAAEQVAT
jgi:uncharacterized protein YndB with AHSA1/START domain